MFLAQLNVEKKTWTHSLILIIIGVLWVDFGSINRMLSLSVIKITSKQCKINQS